MRIEWSAGAWTNPPERTQVESGDLIVTAVEGSDAWRHTSYGLVHDSEHALLSAFEPNTAVEVDFTADLTQDFDQAGVFLRASDLQWVKAGVEFSDGAPQVGAVVTQGKSDWSVAHVPTWQGERVTIRVSWTGDAVTMRAGICGDELRLVRVFPFAAADGLSAGPFVCAPSRAGLAVRFHEWRVMAADESLH